MNRDIIFLGKNAGRLGIALTQKQLALFEVYKKELLEWNARTNLISDNSSREIITRHFLDSLMAWQFIQRPSSKIIDIGSGAGFPGIPLKIAFPDLEIYLLEANRKKVSFLKHVLRQLNISGASVVHDRVENMMQTDEWKEKFDFVVSRATFKLDELVRLSEFFLAPGGQLIALKGPHVDEEFLACEKAEKHRKITQLIQYDVHADFLDAPRKIIIGKK